MAQKNIIKSIISSPLVQTFLIYVSGGWIALEMTDYIINKYNLNEKISDMLPIILLIGLPIAIFLAWYLSREKEEGMDSGQENILEESLSIPEVNSRILLSSLKSPKILFPGILIIIAIVITVIFRMRHQSNIRWAKEQAIPEIIQLYSKWVNLSEAYEIALNAQKYIPKDPELIDLLFQISLIYQFRPTLQMQISI